LGEDDGPYARLRAGGDGPQIGELRRFQGQGIEYLLHLALGRGDDLDAAMLVVFTDVDSSVPHLVVDAARIGAQFALFADLVPRVDLVEDPGYLARVYTPLTEHREALQSRHDMKPRPVPMSLAPYVSPWMCGLNCGDEQLNNVATLYQPYVDHWRSLLAAPPECRADPAALRARDRHHRRTMYRPEADPVWAVLGNLLGQRDANRVMAMMHGHEAG